MSTRAAKSTALTRAAKNTLGAKEYSSYSCGRRCICLRVVSVTCVRPTRLKAVNCGEHTQNHDFPQEILVQCALSSSSEGCISTASHPFKLIKAHCSLKTAALRSAFLFSHENDLSCAALRLLKLTKVVCLSTTGAALKSTSACGKNTCLPLLVGERLHMKVIPSEPRCLSPAGHPIHST